MATDYISREECIKDLREYEKTAFSGLTVIGCISRIKRIPAADVRPVVRGEWKNAHPSSPMLDGGGRPYCPICGEEAPMRSVEKNQWKLVSGCISGPEVVYSEETYFSNFCPNCGADMREVKSDG